MLTQGDFVLDVDFLNGLEPDLVPAHVAVVGAGRWGKVMCNVLDRFSPPLSRIVLVAERNYPAAARWLEERKRETPAAPSRIALSRSLADVLESDQISVAFVTKMASEHYETARRLLIAGKHVLVEKPFVTEPWQAAELVRLAHARRRTLVVGYEYMFARTFHYFRDLIAEHVPDAASVRVEWDDGQGIEKWGIRKQPDVSANVVTDLYPHVLSQLLVLFGRQPIAVRDVKSRDGCLQADINLTYGSLPVAIALDKTVEGPGRREIVVTSTRGTQLRLDYTKEPGRAELDGRELPPDSAAISFPASLDAEVAYFFAQTKRPHVMLPNAAEDTLHFVESTDCANRELVARQVQEVRTWLWKDLPASMPESVGRILRHQLVGALLRHECIDNPKDLESLDRWSGRTFRIVHRLSRDPWATQASLLEEHGITRNELIRLNAAMRESDFVQDLIVRQGLARKYWSTILPLVDTGAIQAVLANTYQFPLRLGIYAAVSCMFSCTFCGRMENPDARYTYDDVPPGNELFADVFAAMPRGISTLSLGGGLEPLTNPRLDDVIRSAKRCGHKVPLVTNGYMLTPLYVKRHEGLWDVDVLRISLYGVDEPSYLNVTKKRGAFQIVKNNVIEFLKERRRRGSGPKVGFNFIVLVNTTDEVLKLLDLVGEIDAAVGGPGIDFLTLREDFSLREGEGLSAEERRNLVAIFDEFRQRRRVLCPDLSVDIGYALYPLSEGFVSTGLAMVGHQGMLPKAYPQVSVALDLLGDVYLYRDAVFPDRPGAARYRIGTISKSQSLEMVVRRFLDEGRAILPQPNDPWLMDAFDHVVTNLIWQARRDEQTGIPLSMGPIRYATRRTRDGDAAPSRPVVNYWQGLFGA